VAYFLVWVERCTILGGSFNDKRAFSRYWKTWTEMLQESEGLTINVEAYVHWYDYFTNYVV